MKDVQSDSYTTTDGLVISHVAFITTFNLVCESGSSDNLLLFADVPAIGRLAPVTRSQDGKKYQVSWTEELAKASYGDRTVRIFDESSLKSGSPITTLTVNHRGTYTGPLIPMEMIAVAAIVFVWYSAYNAKAKLTA